MKKFFAFLLIAIMCVGLVACNKPADNTTPTTSSPETSTATANAGPVQIVISRPVDSDNLDPVMQDGNVNIWVYTLCLEPLILATEDGQDVMPGLAEKWEVSTDGLTYTFHLYKDLKFSDGTPVTKDDIVWSLERIMTTAESPWTSFYSNWESVTCPDDQTVIVKTKVASAVDLPTFSLFAGVITSKAHFDKVGPEQYSKGPIGTGPFMFKEWVQGEYMTLVKNPYYRFADKVKADEIKFTVVPDDNTRIMQLQAGEADIMTMVPYNRLKELNDTDGLNALIAEGNGMWGLAFNTLMKPLDKLDVRKALIMATNKQEIVTNVFYDNVQVADSFLPPSVPLSAAGSITVPAYDATAAKALLAKAGYPNGFDMTVTIRAGNTVQEQMATILKDQWAKIGVNLKIDVLEYAALRPLRNDLKLQCFFGGWTSDIPDPSQQTRYYCIPEVTQDMYTSWNDPAIAALALKAENEMDKTKRADLYKQIQQAYADGCAFMTIYYEGNAVAMKDSITGFVEIPLGNYRFDNLSKN